MLAALDHANRPLQHLICLLSAAPAIGMSGKRRGAERNVGCIFHIRYPCPKRTCAPTFGALPSASPKRNVKGAYHVAEFHDRSS
jgi:hypothetical protein